MLNLNRTKWCVLKVVSYIDYGWTRVNCVKGDRSRQTFEKTTFTTQTPKQTKEDKPLSPPVSPTPRRNNRTDFCPRFVSQLNDGLPFNTQYARKHRRRMNVHVHNPRSLNQERRRSDDEARPSFTSTDVHHTHTLSQANGGFPFIYRPLISRFPAKKHSESNISYIPSVSLYIRSVVQFVSAT